MVQKVSLLDVLDISWLTSKVRISNLLRFRFIEIIREKKLLFRKNSNLLILTIFVKLKCVYKERYFTIEGAQHRA